MALQRTQSLVDTVREVLGVSKGEVSDDTLWENTKNSFLIACVALTLALDNFKNVFRKTVESLNLFIRSK